MADVFLSARVGKSRSFEHKVSLHGGSLGTQGRTLDKFKFDCTAPYVTSRIRSVTVQVTNVGSVLPRSCSCSVSSCSIISRSSWDEISKTHCRKYLRLQSFLDRSPGNELDLTSRRNSRQKPRLIFSIVVDGYVWLEELAVVNGNSS